MTEPLYLALDQGGHASRAIAMTSCGQTVADSFVNIETQRFDEYRVEHDALELADSLKKCCADIAQQLGERTPAIKAVGMATQRSSIVCWSKTTGLPLTPVLSWQDRRAWQLIETKAPHTTEIEQITGLVLSPHYGASKLRWCLENDAQVRDALQRSDLVIGPLASFLIRQLTGSKTDVCDPANASRTLLWNRHTCNWSERLCKLFGVEQALLPRSVPSYFRFGDISVGGIDIPLTTVTGDQSAAIYAFGTPGRDSAYVNLGTGAFLQWPAGREAESIPGILNSVVLQDEQGPEYVLEGTVNGSGSALAWLAKQHNADQKALVADGIKLLESEEPPVFLNGISGLGAPFWISDFESRFLSDAPPALCAVAVLESIAFLLEANIRQISGNGRPLKQIIVTGGLSRVDYLCQIIADLSQTTVMRSNLREATAKGVAFLLGRDPQFPGLAQMTRFEHTTNPLLLRRHLQWSHAMSEAGAGLP